MHEEMAHYRAHHDIASDLDGLARLRADCTDVLRAALPAPASGLGNDALLDALLAALRFRPFPEVAGVLRDLRAAGAVLVVVSNWDVSLHEVWSAPGSRALVDAVADVGGDRRGEAGRRDVRRRAGARRRPPRRRGARGRLDRARRRGRAGHGDARRCSWTATARAGAVPAGVPVVSDLRGVPVGRPVPLAPKMSARHPPTSDPGPPPEHPERPPRVLPSARAAPGSRRGAGGLASSA